MDKYSRLLVHFSTITGSKEGPIPYPNFVKELSIFESPSEELCKIIKDDLHTILPAVLILSTHEDAGIRTAMTRTFDTFLKVVKSNPSPYCCSWWRDMEEKLVAQ